MTSIFGSFTKNKPQLILKAALPGGFLYFSIVSAKKLCYNANIYNYFYKQEIFTYE